MEQINNAADSIDEKTNSTNTDESSVVIDQVSDAGNRCYHAPRLDQAYLAQPYLLKWGGIVVTLLAVLGFVLPYDGFLLFSVAGFLGYWSAYFKGKSRLTSTEEDLARTANELNHSPDISEIRLFLFRFGPVLGWVMGVITVIIMILMFIANRSD